MREREREKGRASDWGYGQFIFRAKVNKQMSMEVNAQIENQVTWQYVTQKISKNLI